MDVTEFRPGQLWFSRAAPIDETTTPQDIQMRRGISVADPAVDPLERLQSVANGISTSGLAARSSSTPNFAALMQQHSYSLPNFNGGSGGGTAKWLLLCSNPNANRMSNDRQVNELCQRIGALESFVSPMNCRFALVKFREISAEEAANRLYPELALMGNC